MFYNISDFPPKQYQQITIILIILIIKMVGSKLELMRCLCVWGSWRNRRVSLFSSNDAWYGGNGATVPLLTESHTTTTTTTTTTITTTALYTTEKIVQCGKLGRNSD